MTLKPHNDAMAGRRGKPVRFVPSKTVDQLCGERHSNERRERRRHDQRAARLAVSERHQGRQSPRDKAQERGAARQHTQDLGDQDREGERRPDETALPEQDGGRPGQHRQRGRAPVQ